MLASAKQGEIRPGCNADGEVLQVTVLWGDQPIEVRQFEPKRTVWVGPSSSDDIHLDGVQPFAVARWSDGVGGSGGGWVGCEPVVASESPQVGGAVALERGKKVRIPAGRHACELEVVQRAQRARARGTIDFRLARTTTIAAMFGVTVLAAMMITDIDATPVSDPITQGIPRGFFVRVPEKQKTRPTHIQLPPPIDKVPQTVKFDGPKPTQTEGSRRDADRKRVNEAGLLGGMKKAGDAWTELTSGQGLGTVINAGLGMLGTTVVASADGMGGMGPRGTGMGGGAELGLTGFHIGTIHGRLQGAEFHGATKAKVTVVPTGTKVIGSGCERSVIGSAIAKYQNHVRMCYERELQKSPELAGKVTVNFTIDPTGGVSEAVITDDEMANSNLETCIVDRILRWKFPEPKNSGVCVINYPWIFRSAGAGAD